MSKSTFKVSTRPHRLIAETDQATFVKATACAKRKGLTLEQWLLARILKAINEETI